MSLESSLKADFIRKIRETFPDAIVLKNDANYLQGVPDILVLIGPRWVALEYKRHPTSAQQANQGYYVTLMNEMSYAAFVWPGNERDILDELQRAFKPRRAARISRTQ